MIFVYWVLGFKALHQLCKGISVFVVGEDQKARQVMITLGIGTGDQIEVSGDLGDGDTVIIRGNERLRPGQSVTIMQG